MFNFRFKVRLTAAGESQAQRAEKVSANQTFTRVQVLWWSGESLATDLLAIKPEVAIASAATLDPDTLSRLRKGKTQVFWTGRDGAIQSTPSGKFEAIIEATENNASLL